MSGQYSTENLLARFGSDLVPVKVDIWTAKKPRMTAICFHEYFGTSEEFHVLGQRCAERDITVVAPALPGRHPSAFFTGRLRYELPTFLSLMLQIAERYQSNKNCLIGHGFGGLLCLAAVRAKLLRPDAIILDEVPLTGSWQASPMQALTHLLSNLSADDPETLSLKILLAAKENGFGQFSPNWAKSLIRPLGGSFRTILDPALATAAWPDFDFTAYLEKCSTETTVFCCDQGTVMPNLVKTAVPLNPNIRIFKYSGPFKPGFAITSYPIINSIFRNIIDK